jgi:hypothetical protein
MRGFLARNAKFVVTGASVGETRRESENGRLFHDLRLMIG